MKVLGIDPASTRLAVVLWDESTPTRLWRQWKFGKRWESYSTHRVQESLGSWLSHIDQDDDERLAYLEAPVVGVGGVRSTLVQAYMSGAIQSTLWSAGFRVHLIPNTTWKRVVVGKGNAKKPEVMAWAVEKFPSVMESTENDQDVADALALTEYGRVQVETMRAMEREL